MRNFQHPYLVCNRHYPLSDLEILKDYPEDGPTQQTQQIHEYEVLYKINVWDEPPATELWKDLEDIKITVNSCIRLLSHRSEYSPAEFNSQHHAISQTIDQLLHQAFLNSFEIL
jgi:hypothetical protein